MYRKEIPHKLRFMTGLTKIDDILKASLKHFKIEEKFKVYPIWKAWESIVGTQISKKTSPAFVSGKTLHIQVENSVWMQELEYQKRGILKQIDKVLPEAGIKMLQFILKPADPKPVR